MQNHTPAHRGNKKSKKVEYLVKSFVSVDSKGRFASAGIRCDHCGGLCKGGSAAKRLSYFYCKDCGRGKKVSRAIPL